MSLFLPRVWPCAGMQAERPYWEDDEGEEEEEEDDGEDERVLVGVGGYDLDVYARKIEVDNWVQLGGEPVGRMVKTRLEPQQLLTVGACGVWCVMCEVDMNCHVVGRCNLGQGCGERIKSPSCAKTSSHIVCCQKRCLQ